MIVVTGATGHFGRKTVDVLLRSLPPSEIGVSVRDTSKAGDLGSKGIRVAKADFSQRESLITAFDGAEQVLIVSANALGPEKIKLHENAISAAKDAGVKRVVYTSHQAASRTSKVEFARDHAATEKLLEKSGVPFVALRNGFYAESLIYQLGGLKESKTLALPSDGPVSWTSRDDLAEAAAIVLLQPGKIDGVSSPLTNSRTYTFEDVAGIASSIVGIEISFQKKTFDAYKAEAAKKGLPAERLGLLLGMFEAIQDREFDVVSPALEKLLNRRPTALQQILAGALK